MKKAKFKIILAVLFMCALLAVGMISPAFTRTYASTASRTEYSDVLSDLRKDSAFNVADYPQNPKDYSVKVIQVAESVNGELFVYIYQPNAGVNVTSMNMATKYSDLHAGDIKNYKLRLLNISGALAKYAVKNFKIGAENIRYYNIISAFREWIDGVDSVSGNENDISEVSYEVAKCYVVETEKGQIAYSCFETETIMITDKYVGYIRYPNGHYLFASYSSLDSFYVAFNTDKRMDKLMEADVSFVYLKESRNYFLWWEVRHDINATGEMEVSLTADDVGISEKLDEFPYYGGNTYSWKRIETAQSFLANEDLTDEAKSNLRNKQWVLRFAEFDYKSFYNLASMELNTAVEQVTILRLKFETDGKVYNLGVVDNKQAPAPDQEPDNKQENTGSNHFGNILKKFGEWLKDLFSRLFHGDLKWWEWVVFAVIVIVVLVIISILVRILKFIVEPFRRKKKDNKE